MIALRMIIATISGYVKLLDFLSVFADFPGNKKTRRGAFFVRILLPRERQRHAHQSERKQTPGTDQRNENKSYRYAHAVLDPRYHDWLPLDAWNLTSSMPHCTKSDLSTTRVEKY
jgi:hypothetical protein